MEQMKKIILEKSTLLTLLVTSSVFMGGTCVFAEEPVERFTLGEFVVTASRVATNKSDKLSVKFPGSMFLAAEQKVQVWDRTKF